MCGTQPPGWRADLDWALAPLGKLRPVASRTDAVPGGQVLELRTTSRSTTPIALPEIDTDDNLVAAVMTRQERSRTELSRSQPRYADLARVLTAAPRPGLVLRHHLAGAEQIEREMLADELRLTWPGSEAECALYAGTPVRLRSFMASYDGPVLARIRALLRVWGSWIEFDAVDRSPLTAGGCCPSRPACGPDPGRAHGVGDPAFTRRWSAGVPGHVDRNARAPAHAARPGPEAGSRGGPSRSGLCRAVQEAGGSYTRLDPEGSTVDALIADIAQTSRRHVGRVRVVRHGDPELDALLNLLAADAAGVEAQVALFAEMVQRSQDPRHQGMVGPRWHRWFTLVALRVHAHLGSRASLVAVAAVASDMNRIRRLAAALKADHPDLSHRLSSECGGMWDAETADLISWGVSKLGPLVASSALRWILGAGPDSLDVPAMMDAGESLAIDLGAHRIGGPAAETLGAVHLLKHWAALGARQHRDRPHVVVVDEAHRLGHGPSSPISSPRRGSSAWHRHGHPAHGSTIGRARRRTGVHDRRVRQPAVRGPGLDPARPDGPWPTSYG